VTSAHVLVLPGSGYFKHAEHEGEPIAQWLRSLGYDSSVFWYPVQSRHPVPLDALTERILQLRRDGVTQLAILGFSAGGHLAGHAALTLSGDARPDAAILAYPVVSMVTEHHAGSRENLLGSEASDAERRSVSLELLVHDSVPPFFIWHTTEDTSVPVEHSLRLAHSLGDHGGRYELHVYQHGYHGVGMAEGFEGTSDWTAACGRWLERTFIDRPA
jgi:acetyl esterase/lipase